MIHDKELLLYPLFLDLRNRPILLVGGGEVAFRKAERLVLSKCKLKVVSPQVIPDFESLIASNKCQWEARAYRSGEARDYFMVISATNRPDINRLVYQDALSAGVLINVVDRPEFCNVLVPSTLIRGSLQIAISTSGKCPALAKHLRIRLEQLISERYGPLLDKLEIIRTEIQKKVDICKDRKRYLNRIVSSRAVENFLAGDPRFLDNIIKGWKKVDKK